jgi:hypothetical protein
MNLHKWIERKYPNHYKELIEKFAENQLEYLKIFKFKVGILTKKNGKNKVGDLVLFKRSKEYIDEHENGYEYPCSGGWTGSFQYSYIYQKTTDSYSTTTFYPNCEEI